MPTYEYRCDNGHTFEVMQKMTDDPVQSCTVCEARVQRVFHPVAVHFKGKGFYTTDYGTRRRARETEREGGGGAEKKDSTASKPETKPSSSETSGGSASAKSDAA